MARQTGPIKIKGCFDHICFYRMGGEYYARRKSSLTGKRVKRDRAFAKTMEYAGILGRASKTASTVYRLMSAEEKKERSFRVVTGEIMALLREGVAEEVIVLLLRPATEKKKAVVRRVQQKKETFSFAEEVLQRLFCPWPIADDQQHQKQLSKAPP
ncbi:MAG: hypothetical protein JNN00_11545 [Chitinophagaceae bacterium]|nr:hypothetical protein [Chitinophagaceae bacterium]